MSESLAVFEWSIDPREDNPDDPEAWARANPGLGIRISVEHVARERAAMSPETFARERLGIGTYPSDGSGWAVIPREKWEILADSASEPTDPVAFAVSITPDRVWTSVGTAGRRADGLIHAELVQYRRGTGWVPDRMAELGQKWSPCAIVVDSADPAGSLVPEMEARGLAVTVTSARDMAQACGGFYDGCGANVEVDAEPRIRHLDQAPLNTALAGAVTRPLGDLWAWSRKGQVDISPLVAVTLAVWGFTGHGHEGAGVNVLNTIW